MVSVSNVVRDWHMHVCQSTRNKVLMVLVVTLVPLSTSVGNASAQTSTIRQTNAHWSHSGYSLHTTTNRSGRPTMVRDRRWYGWDLLLNKSETATVQFGAGGAAVIATSIPDVTLSKIVAGGLGLFSSYATWIVARGGCLKFRILYSGHIIPAHYFGGYCN